MMTAKPEVIEKVGHTPEEEDKIELGIKERELKEKEEVVVNNLKQVKEQEERFILGMRELEIEHEQYTIVEADPLGYDKSEAWAKVQKKLMNFKMDVLQLKREQGEMAHKTLVKQLKDQIGRCEKDIPVLTKRIGVLKAKKY